MFMNFWRDGFSINEAKISMLVICMAVCVVAGIAFYFFTGNLVGGFVDIAQALIFSVAGVNGATVISDALKKGANNE